LVEGAAPRMPKVFDFSPVRRPNFILVCKFLKKPLQELIQKCGRELQRWPTENTQGGGGFPLAFSNKKVCKNFLI